MKLKYEKPMLAVEKFRLAQSIAACSQKIGFSNSSCVLGDVDSTNHMKDMALAKGWFINSSAEGCQTYPEEMSGEDGVCYHTSANAYFTS